MPVTINTGDRVDVADATTLTVTSAVALDSGSISISCLVESQEHPAVQSHEVAFIVPEKILSDPDATKSEVLTAALAESLSDLAWVFNFGGDPLALEAARRASLASVTVSEKAAAAVHAARLSNGRLSHLEADIQRYALHHAAAER